ncbi:MAG: cobamide remodeling phosphodiesterase CbiR [Thermoleophilia bacterium]
MSRDGAGYPGGAYSSLLFGTTSYVLPADLLPNVRLLAPFVDDIELILFEGEASNLPSRTVVREIAAMGADAGCGFTVHLPLDAGIGEDDHTARRRAQDTCLRVIDLTLPLEPHAFVVHPELPLRHHPALGEAPKPLHSLPPDEHRAWLHDLGESLGRFAPETGPYPLAVENLQFSFEWVSPLLEEYDLGVTLDVGHLLSHGGDLGRHLEEFGHRLTVVHLHGLDGPRDHQEIGLFDGPELQSMLDLFAAAPTARPAYTPRPSPTRPPAPTGAGTGGGESSFGPVVVSLEVFGWKPTVASLRTLADLLGESRGGRFAAAAVAVMEELPRWTSFEAADPF